MLNRAHHLSVRFKFYGVPWQAKTHQGREPMGNDRAVLGRSY